jgi:hypothetical protein
MAGRFSGSEFFYVMVRRVGERKVLEISCYRKTEDEARIEHFLLQESLGPDYIVETMKLVLRSGGGTSYEEMTKWICKYCRQCREDCDCVGFVPTLVEKLRV